MKKRVLARSISMVLVCIIFFVMVGCGKESGDPVQGDNEKDPGSAVKETEEPKEDEKGFDPMAKYDDLVEISMYGNVSPTMNFDNGETFEDNLWSKLYEDELNIKVVYKWIVNEDQYEQKLNVSIASKDLPDIMSFNVSDKNFALLSENDQLQDLKDVYDKYATGFTKQLIFDASNVAIESGTVNGQLLGIPNTNATIEAANILWIRQDWLDATGENAPTTMDELFALMKTFKEADLDGHGADNSWGFGMNKDILTIKGFFSGYGAQLSQWMETEDGSIVYGSIQPEVRDALEALQKLYNDEMLDKEFAVKDSTTMTENINAGKTGIYYGGHASPLWPLISSRENNPDVDWTPFQLPTVNGDLVEQYVSIPVLSYYSVTKDCENPEALVKMMNLFTEKCFSVDTDPLYFTTSEKYREPFKHARVQTWPVTKNIDIYKRILEATETGDMSIIENHQETSDMYSFVKKYEETGVEGWDYTRVFGIGGAEAIMSEYLAQDQIKYNAFYGSPTETMSGKLSSLNKQENEIFTQIIMGDADISKFDEFVANWKKLGGDQITEEVNEWKSQQ